MKHVTLATVREAIEDNNTVWHIECRFSNGEKYAAIKVDGQDERLAHLIVALLNVEAEQRHLRRLWEVT